MIDRHNLPDDIPALKKIIYELLDVIEGQQQIIEAQRCLIEEQKKKIEEQGHQIEELTQKVDSLTHQVQVLQRHRYGPRSEKLSKVHASDSVKDKPAGHGRHKLPEDLPRIRKDHDIESHTCQKCGHLLVKIGEISCEQLDSTPSQFYVIDHRRAKYACRHCQETVIVAEMPAQPIDKGLAASGLLAEVLVNK